MRRKLLAFIGLLFLQLAWSIPALPQASVALYCWNPSGSGLTQFLPCNSTTPLQVSASVSVSGFTAASTGTPISVTTGGVTGTLPSGAVVVATNVGATNGAYCALGASATTSSQYLSPGGGWFAFTVGASTQLTCITSTSTTTVNMTGGAGLPTGTGGGGGSSNNASVSATGSPVPASATYMGVLVGSNLVGLTPGTAGSAGTQVFSVQGIGSMTPLLVNPGTATLWGVAAQAATITSAVGPMVQCSATTSAPSYTNAQINPVNCDLAGNVRVNVMTATGLAQGSTTSGQTGSMIMGAVTTSAPSYTTAQTAYASLDLHGGLRIGGAGYPAGATPITGSATGTTTGAVATLTAGTGPTAYICGFSVRANATAATTVNIAITGTITGTLNFTEWVAPAASGLGVAEEIFTPCIPASAVSTNIVVTGGNPSTGGVNSTTAWGFTL